MQEEKQFGRLIRNAQSILGSQDLLQLRIEHEVWYNPCFICTLTGKVPPEPEEGGVIIMNRTLKQK